MGMTIDEARTALGKERKYALHENKQAFDIAIDTMRKYQQLQADYENRLKADMEAMLEELKAEILELKSYESADGQDLIMLADIGILFQDKITALKEQNND